MYGLNGRIYKNVRQEHMLVRFEIVWIMPFMSCFRQAHLHKFHRILSLSEWDVSIISTHANKKLVCLCHVITVTSHGSQIICNSTACSAAWLGCQQRNIKAPHCWSFLRQYHLWTMASLRNAHVWGNYFHVPLSSYECQNISCLGNEIWN